MHYAAVGIAGGLSLSLANPSSAEIRPVRQVQQTLSDQGFEAGSADGIWGAKSVAALKAFQRAKGLNPTGVIDQATLQQLFPDARQAERAIAPSSATSVSSMPQVSDPAPKTESSSPASPSPQQNSTGGSGPLRTSSEDTGSSPLGKIFGFGVIFLVVVGVLSRRKPKAPTGGRSLKR
jgi:peptidoglycan hydrolase-like protein with peptidoglycan-binding domain